MKRILAALLLFTTVVFTSADPAVDNEFLKLFRHSVVLNSIISQWNENCNNVASLTDDQKQICDGVKSGLTIALADWVKKANLYKPTGDPVACDTKVYGDIIAVTIKVFNWNLQYGGRKDMSPEDRARASQILAGYMEEKDKVQEEINNCDPTQYNSI